MDSQAREIILWADGVVPIVLIMVEARLWKVEVVAGSREEAVDEVDHVGVRDLRGLKNLPSTRKTTRNFSPTAYRR